MFSGTTPIRLQATRLLAGGKTRGYGTLLLYPDKLAAVSSVAFRVGTTAGAILVFGAGLLIPPHGGPGALGAVVGVWGGGWIGGAIAKSRAAAKVAAGGGNVTVIPLDSVTGVEARKSRGWLGGQQLLVTTADGTQYGFGVKLDEWSFDLGRALAARGRQVYPTPQGLVIMAAPNAWGPTILLLPARANRSTDIQSPLNDAIAGSASIRRGL